MIQEKKMGRHSG